MDSEARAQNNRTLVWEPQDGPQTALLECPVFEVFYGGARGGGKTDGVLGEFASHAFSYGEAAIGLMVRRQRTELIETIERSRQIYGPIGATFEEQSKMWTFPNGARLRFAYLERDADAESYQGHSYCVAVGTRIRMANGRLKAIETIKPGEMVATLEGPRRVSDATPPYVAPCVLAVVRDSSGSERGRQYHPVWHPVLTTAGLISSQSVPRSGICEQLHSAPRAVDTQGRVPSPYDRQEIPAWVSWSEDGRSGCKGSRQTHPNVVPPQSLTFPVVLHEQYRPSAPASVREGRSVSMLSHARGILRKLFRDLRRASEGLSLYLKQLAERARSIQGRFSPAHANAVSYGQSGLSEAQDWKTRYWSDPDLYGGYARAYQETGQALLPSPGGAGSERHKLPLGASDTTQERSQMERQQWVHPYTGEARHLSEAVTSGTMELSYHGPMMVADLTIESANHYISECGLVNKNTRVYVEEIGNFPSPTPIMKLMATLRSGAGIPCCFRATGNPGGPGHQWVKARYIDPARGGYKIITSDYVNPYTNETLKRERIFIPSFVKDNKYLGAEYVANLQMSGSENLVKAWLFGDWDIVEGAFFDRWSLRNIIKPFRVPDAWPRFRAMDWGYATPFAVGWWAVAGDNSEEFGIPKEALVMYREWYGMEEGRPNVGLRLSAEEQAEGILKRSLNEKYLYNVIDPAAFTEAGGPSIAERMARKGMEFRRADNRRLGERGHMGGWDQLRARIAGQDGRPMLYVFETCVDLIRTLPTLQHDPDRPEDLDTKQEDHAADQCFIAGTMVQTANGPKPIETLVVGEMVETRQGLSPIEAVFSIGERDVFDVLMSNGRSLTGTANHPVFVEGEWISLASLRYADILSTCAKQSYSRASNITAIQRIKIAIAGSIIGRIATRFTGQFGKAKMDQFNQKIWSFTTAILTRSIMKFPIWSWSQNPTMPKYIGKRLNQSGSIAGIARMFSGGIHGIMRNFAAMPAGLRRAGHQWLMMLTRCAPLADLHIVTINTKSKNTVPGAAAPWGNMFVHRSHSLVLNAENNASPKTGEQPTVPLHVVSVTPAGKQKVFNLTVTGAEEYYANGVLVHNCRYAVMSRPWLPAPPKKDKPGRNIHEMTMADAWEHLRDKPQGSIRI